MSMDNGWRVGFADDEIILEFVKAGKIEIIVSIEQGDIGYAILKNGTFSPGSYDATTDLPAAIEEIKCASH